MSYSIDLRKRVVGFVKQGGSKAEASRRFAISLWCVNDWVKRGNDLVPRVTGPKKSHTFDWGKLRESVEKNPDLMLKEHAKTFGVSTSAIFSALRKMGISRKKKRHVITKKRSMKVGGASI